MTRPGMLDCWTLRMPHQYRWYGVRIPASTPTYTVKKGFELGDRLLFYAPTKDGQFSTLGRAKKSKKSGSRIKSYDAVRNLRSKTHCKKLQVRSVWTEDSGEFEFQDD